MFNHRRELTLCANPLRITEPIGQADKSSIFLPLDYASSAFASRWILFDYSLLGGLPAGSRTAWSRLPLQPLIAGGLTPFSHSLIAEIAGRAWYQYFDRLGFDPMPKARILRQYQGWPYLNLTLSAQRDAEYAGLEPLTLRLDGQLFPLCKWEKPGLLASFKAGLNQKKINDTLKSLGGELESITQQAQQWQAKTESWRWTQAEILQVMEEIEQVAPASFIGFFAARYNVELAYNRLIRATLDKMAYPTALPLIAAATSDAATYPIEHDMAQRLLALSDLARRDQATLDWLQAGLAENWAEHLPNRAVTAGLMEFLALYGHRCVDEGEVRNPRWREDPTPLFKHILAQASQAVPPLSPAGQSADSERQLLAAVEGNQRKEAQQSLQKIRQLMALQSRALHAFAYVLNGARRWTLAAAKEALSDQRLTQIDDVFFFELEETKRMMTNEWNISDKLEIQNLCTRRQAEYRQGQLAVPPALLIGDTEAVQRPADLPAYWGNSLPTLLKGREVQPVRDL